MTQFRYSLLYWRSMAAFCLGLASLVFYLYASLQVDALPLVMVVFYLVGRGLKGGFEPRSLALMGLALLPISLVLLLAPRTPALEAFHTITVFFFAGLLPMAFFFPSLARIIDRFSALTLGAFTDRHAAAFLETTLHRLRMTTDHPTPLSLTITLFSPTRDSPSSPPRPGTVDVTHNGDHGPIFSSNLLQTMLWRTTGFACAKHRMQSYAYRESAHDALTRLSSHKSP